MKLFLLSLVTLFSLNAMALNPSLEPAVKMVETCLVESEVLLCNPEITEVLKTVSMDARGEFVYFLKDVLNKNETPKTVVNLFEELQKLVPLYEKLDGCDQWSCRDLKVFLGDVSIRYVKIAPIKATFLSELYAKQAAQAGRYGLLQTMHAKAAKVTDVAEMEELIKFGEFTKDHSRSIGDEFYLYEAAVDLIKKMTVKTLKLNPGYEGVYSVEFEDSEMAEKFKIDSVVIMNSGERDALVVNFVSSKLRTTRFSFKAAGILGNKIFSNQDVYENRPDISAPYFNIVLDRETKTVKGTLSSVRLGKSIFKGDLVQSNATVFTQGNVQGLTLEQLVGSYKVTVGNYPMTLKIAKRTAERTVYEASLVNSNALIVFSKVELDSTTGVLSLVDWKNERKLTLGVTDFNESATTFSGFFFNGPLALALEISSL